ncbi:MAG: hypothetical protein DWQ07_04775 [Chloroflexi bacterium]|nr:MAG: hypothetical protein DWQ07_04775 [Chloroflexota bacterium]MBL1194745.1 hypothetical protein [Chloroflexota bacterium]NOH12037.1 hypothetical protein [Chloroflexota bacterium]
MKHYRLIASLFVLTILLTACNLPGGENISEEDAVRFAQETLQAQMDAQNQQQAQDQAAPPADQPPAAQPPAGDAATPTETLIPATPTITLTPTSAVPMVSVSTATNCRNGPGIPYDIVGSLSPGQNGNIAAQSSVNNYVLIQNPAGGPNCWLWLQHATITGDISSLPVVTPPPSPTPTFTPTPEIDWTGTWNTDADGAVTMNITQTGNSVSGSGTGGGVTVTINGTVSANGMTVSGTYSTNLGGSGSFTWQLIGGSMDQFNGNYQQTLPAAGNGPWCGGRNGAGLPATCLGP